MTPSSAADCEPTGPTAGEEIEYQGASLSYRVNLPALGSIAEKFVPLTLDAEGQAFVAHALGRRYSRTALWLKRLLTLFLSDFDTNALLEIHPVFLLSTAQAHRLLGRFEGGRLLDVGSGSGDVVTRLAALVDHVQCTEVSRMAARRLRKRGLACWRGALGSGAPGDPLRSPHEVVSLCNVIDRCERPKTLLRLVAEHLGPGGKLLLSVPLPLDPFFYHGGRCLAPLEKLDVPGQRWEDAASQLWQRELAPLGLELRALSRLPYLSGGDASHPLYALDTALLVCVKRA